MNDAYLRGTGLTRDIVGRPFLDVLSAGSAAEPNATTVRNLRASLEKVLMTKTRDEMSAQRYDIRLPALGGGGLEERHWLPINTPVVGEDGLIDYIVHCVGESTERVRFDRRTEAGQVRAEATRLETETVARQAMDRLGASVDQQPQTLLDSDIRFRAIYDNALDAMLIADDAGTIIDANVAATVLFGRDRADILMARTSDLLPEPDMPTGPCAQLMNDPLQRGQRRIVRPDGRVVHVEYSARTHFLPGRHLSVLRDIEERMRTEELLRFLAEASAVLASSLDYQATLQGLANIAVPTLADWAAVDMVEADGSLSRAAAAHVDASKVDLVYELAKAWPSCRDDTTGPVGVARTLRFDLATEVSDECLGRTLGSGPALSLALRVGMRSRMHVPLVVRGKCVGVLTFGAGD